MTRCQVGTKALSTTMIGFPVKFTISLLHWYVAIAHDVKNVYIHDTGSDAIALIPLEQFASMREWSNGGFDKKVREILIVDGTCPKRAYNHPGFWH